MKNTKTHKILVVDFIQRKLVHTHTFQVQEKTKKVQFDFTNFNPVPEDSNFASFSEQDRMEYSDHVLKHIKEASFADLVHWANMGMVDMIKVNKALGIDISRQPKKRKKT